MKTKLILPLLAASLVFAMPATSFADRTVTVYRDLDRDGHYNKKTYKVNDSRYYRGGAHYGGRYYGSPYAYGYRQGSYRSYGYRSYPRTAIGLSIYSRPTYAARPVYRGEVVNNRLAVDVQRELKRRGYYYGSIDGVIGNGSRAAIRAYQRDQRMAITGRIDSALLRSLRI
jgi:hypothetical protein